MIMHGEREGQLRAWLSAGSFPRTRLYLSVYRLVLLG